MNPELMRYLLMMAPDGGGDGGEGGGDTGGDTGGDPAFTDGEPAGEGAGEGEEGGSEGDPGSPTDPPKILSQASDANKSRKDLFAMKKLDDYIAEIDRLKSATRFPGDDASPEEKETFMKEVYKQLGIPEDLSEYEVGENFAKKAAELKLTKDQAKAVADMIDNATSDAYQEIKATAVETEKSLKQEWGKEYKAKIANMGKAIDIISDVVPDIKDFLRTTKAGNSPQMIKALEYIGSIFSEDGIPLGQGKGGLIDDREAMLREAYPTMF